AVRAVLKRRMSTTFHFDFENFAGMVDKHNGWSTQSPTPPMILMVLPLLLGIVSPEDLEILKRDREVPFPGRQQWDAEIAQTAAHLHDELMKAAPELHSILRKNAALLARHDVPATDYPAIENVRAALVEALVPAGRWAVRGYQQIQDGQTRMKAY